MSAEGNAPFQGGKPSEPPRGVAPGQPGYLGPGMAPPTQSSSAGGGKRFCANCGKEWPTETKFCTACGTWMQGEDVGKKSYKEHIEQQLQERGQSGEAMPTFAQEGPPKKEKRGRSPLVNVVIVLLCAVLIIGGITYSFFQGEASVLIGKYMVWRGKYAQAAGWYNTARKIKTAGRVYDWATENMAAVSLQLYSEYLDAMKYKDWTADVEVEGGPQKTWKLYSSSDGGLRAEIFGPVAGDKEDVVKLIIETEGKRHVYDYATKGYKPADLNENEKKSRTKSEKEKVLSSIKEYASTLYIEEKTEKVDGKKCFALIVRIKNEKRADFPAIAGLNGEYPGVSGAPVIKFSIGIDDKLLYRISILPEGGNKPTASFTFKDIKIGESIPSGAFGLGKELKRRLE